MPIASITTRRAATPNRWRGWTTCCTRWRPLELRRVTAPLAAEDDVLRAHPAGYLAELRGAMPDDGIGKLDEDTFVSPGSLTAAYRGAGAAVRGVDMVLGGEVTNAFCRRSPAGPPRRARHADGVLPAGQRGDRGQARA